MNQEKNRKIRNQKEIKKFQELLKTTFCYSNLEVVLPIFATFVSVFFINDRKRKAVAKNIVKRTSEQETHHLRAVYF